VASPVDSPSVSSTTHATIASESGAVHGGRLLSRSRPATPAAMNRSCQRHTVALAQATWRMMPTVPTPSALSSTIRGGNLDFDPLAQGAMVTCAIPL
jgi:hypothetical protein